MEINIFTAKALSGIEMNSIMLSNTDRVTLNYFCLSYSILNLMFQLQLHLLLSRK